MNLDEDYQTSNHRTVPEDHDLNIVSFVSSGVVWNLDTAKSLQEWLGDKIEVLEDIEKERGK